MRKVLSVVLVALLATMGSAVHDFDIDAHHQGIFSHARRHQSDPDDDDGVIYIPPSDSRRSTDLDTTMQNLIDDEMATIYHPAKYVKSLKAKLCNQKTSLYNCQIEILEEPTIQVIPTRLISRDLYCNTRACSISFTDHDVDVWTTHITENGLKMEAGAEPFNAGVEFTASAGYGFSADSRTFASLAHTFHLRRGDFGHVSIVNAQVSAKVRLVGCKCTSEVGCASACKKTGPNYSEVGHHEVVVLKNGTPRSYVGFVHRKKENL